MVDPGQGMVSKRGRLAVVALLGLASLGAGGLPEFGPERTVSEESWRDEVSARRFVTVTSGSEGFLVGWRAGLPDVSASVARAIRLDSSGQPVDAHEFTLSARSGYQAGAPALAAGHDEYLALWHEPNFLGVAAQNSLLRAALVRPSPSPGDATRNPVIARFPVHNGSWDNGSLAVAFDDRVNRSTSNRYLVVHRAHEGLVAQWIDPVTRSAGQTTVLRGAPFLSSGFGDQLALACGAAGCLVVWKETDESHTRVLARTIAVQDAPDALGPVVEAWNPQPASPSTLELSADGDDYLLAIGTTAPMLGVIRLDSGGAPLAIQPVPLQMTGYVFGSALARSEAHHHLLAWHGMIGALPSVFSTTVNTASSSEPPIVTDVQIPVLNVHNESFASGLACSVQGPRCLLGYVSGEWGDMGQLFTVPLTRDRASVDGLPRQVPERPALQRAPSVACDRAGACFSVWHEPGQMTGGSGEVVGALLDGTSGDPLEFGVGPVNLFGASFVYAKLAVAAAPALGTSHRFAVAWTGTRDNRWQDEVGVLASLLNGSREPEPVTIIQPSTQRVFQGPALTASERYYLVAWVEQVNGEATRRCKAARLGFDENPATIPSVQVSLEPTTGEDAVPMETAPLAIYNGRDFVVVWEARRGGRTFLYGQRLTTGGAQLTTLGEPFELLETIPSDEGSAFALASDGEGSSLLVWNQADPSGSLLHSLKATRFSSVGDRLETPFVISEGPRAFRPRAVFDGNSYLVTWSDGSGDGELIHGAWIGKDGRRLSLESSPLSPHPSTDAAPATPREPALASAGGGRTMLVTVRDRFEDETGYVDMERVRAMWLGSPCNFEMPEVLCTATPCMEAGWCNPVTRLCEAQVPKPDFTACAGGLCVAGECVQRTPAPQPEPPPPSPDAASPTDASGCGCRTAGDAVPVAPSAPLTLLALLGLGLTRRRATSSRRRPTSDHP
ncbi:MYXO-CTERM sorting domain-containing protein [Chondromyces crocatus]|uniref:Uncharacterized protein n=1 Tax=Chondromyces crocatus TaxID=52 RepID=A0A0K1ED94_CHOCO|nr:MYXO-CTERM sorting domain-containing protein [Chondromyces crocatus]AKT38819.1 uncharacterized protein CMC5_029650 [Chondromyces crocatus]